MDQHSPPTPTPPFLSTPSETTVRSSPVGAAAHSPAMAVALSRLNRLRTLAQLLLVTQRLGWIAAGFISLAVGVGLIDYFIRSPGWMRGAALVVGLFGAIETLRRLVIPALKFSPPLEELALRVERSDAGRQAGLGGVAASGVGLALAERLSQGVADPTVQASRLLAEPVQSEAARRLAGLGLLRYVQWKPAFKSAAAAGVVMVAVLSLLAAQPRLTWIGAVRVLAPWAGMEWPKRAAVEDATHERVHALGTALALRAGIMRADGTNDGDDGVEARYRLIVDGKAGPTRRLMLTRQERTETITLTNERGQTERVEALLYESLIEPGALNPNTEEKARVAEAEFEYWFTSSDDQTQPTRIKLVAPPVVVSAAATVKPPAYAATIVQPRTADLGAGNDERAALAGVLAGSEVAITIRLNKPVPMPAASDAAAVAAWLRACMGPDAEQVALVSLGKAASEEFAVVARPEKPIRLAVTPVDEHGIKGGEESIYRVDVLVDRPPEATVTKPAENTDVLSTSVVDAAAEGRDDVGLAWIAVEYRIARRPAGSEGGQPEAPDQYTVAARVEAPAGGAVRTLTAAGSLDLSAIGARAGDEVWITALAADGFELDGKRHEPVRSPVRKVRVISEDQLVEQIWAELGGVRRSAMRQAETLQRLEEDVRRGREAESAAREQASVSESVARMAETVAKARQRAEQNGLKDGDLTGVLREARDLLEQAREQSGKAQEALRKAAEADKARQQGAAEQARKEAQAAERAADAALEKLAEALDRGQDAWSSRRSLERLIKDQQTVRESTAKMEQQTSGKNENDLTPAERQAIERLAQEQESLARRAEEAIRKMLERAEQLRQQDPSTSQALQQAAQRGQRSGVPEQMQQTAQQMRQNQQRKAGEQQERSEKALQNMLDELKDAARNRDEVLKRELASIIQTLEALIARQTENLDALKQARAGADAKLTGLDSAMIRLHTATLALLDQARAAGREAKAVAEHVDGAQQAQAKAVGSLRAEPVDGDEAERQEAISLKQLNLAKQEAEKAKRKAQEREQARKRTELKKAYRELLLEQTELKRVTEELVGQPVDRRTRARLRELADRQDQVRLKARAMLEETEELKEADLFVLAHGRLDAAATSAAGPMRDGQATPLVVSRQGVAVRTLQELLDALEEADKQEQTFREQQGGEGQDQQQGGQQKPKLIPDIAQLKMLRALQNEALKVTRESAEAKDAELVKATAQDAADLQATLAKKAEELLKKLQQQQPGMPGGGGE